MKKNLVKISLLLMALLLVFCFVSCDKDNPTNPTTPVEKVYIEFDIGRGADFADEDFEGGFEIEKGTAITEYPEAIKDGYVIEGWYFDEDFEDKCDADYEFDEDTVLFAKWIVKVPDPTFTVTFDASRAENKQNVPAQTIVQGGKVTRPDYEPYRKDNTFVGWCINGDSKKVWNFDKDVVTGNVKLVAVFQRTGGNSTDTCEHQFEVTEYIAPTCELAGRRVEKCVICRKVERYNKDTDPTLARLEHLELEERVEPTCALDGYSKIYCPNGCGLSATITLKATGKHQYDDEKWYAAVQPTKYVNGSYENACIVCNGAILREPAPYGAIESDLQAPAVSFLYTGGKYVNEKFVNVATLGKILASSYFDGTKGLDANDGNSTTFWNADTYVDGADYTADWLELELAKEFEVGAINLLIPNYTAWELGDDCYVSYDIEYWDSTSNTWVLIDEVSDKNAVPLGMNCGFMITLDSPILTSKIRANVTYASRYAPAVIYELEVFAKTEGVERIPVAIAAEATATISGKYNDWVTGADSLKDNTTATYWTTDARYNSSPWAMFEYPEEEYIACIQVSVGAMENRRFALEIYENGQWVKVKDLIVPKAGVTGNGVIANSGGICTFNVDVEKMASKIKLTLTREPEYWTSYVYDITPYTIKEIPYGEAKVSGCMHANPKTGAVVPATCGVPGYTIMNCVCGATIRTKSTDALQHDWGKYTIDTPATVTTIGTKVATCRNEGCGATSTINYEEKYESVSITPYLHNAPAAWAQTFDDGNYLDTYVWANEHYIKYGVRATVMQSITYSDSLVSIWQDHFTKGVFDLGSHSYNHTSIYAGQASTSLISEVINAQYWFRHNYKGQSVYTFAAPLGATSVSVAEYLAGIFGGNRNGGDTGIFYNTIDQLVSRDVWGDLNSYISKADQTEGEYIFVNKSGSVVYLNKKGSDGAAEVTFGNAKFYLTEGYTKAGINLVFDENEMTFVDKGYDAGTYYYVSEDYRYEFRESGSYNLNGNTFEFVEGNDGEYRLLKTTIGSYEKGVEKLFSVGGFTVECLHSLGSGSIYSSYASTISKLEHITRFGMWAPSYNELMKYLKEAQNISVSLTERTDSSITISVSDTLDNYMFNQALTMKVDIPDSWTTVTVQQGGKNIPFASLDEYKHTKNMNNISYTIEDGYLYVDILPDGGDVVITLGSKDDSVADYEEKVIVSFEPGEGVLDSSEYETKVVIGEMLASYPTPVRAGYKFTGWYTDEACSQLISPEYVYETSRTWYAGWEEIPLCTDGTYTHKWGQWLEDDEKEFRNCSACSASEHVYKNAEPGITNDSQIRVEGSGDEELPGGEQDIPDNEELVPEE